MNPTAMQSGPLVRRRAPRQRTTELCERQYQTRVLVLTNWTEANCLAKATLCPTFIKTRVSRRKPRSTIRGAWKTSPRSRVIRRARASSGRGWRRSPPSVRMKGRGVTAAPRPWRRARETWGGTAVTTEEVRQNWEVVNTSWAEILSKFFRMLYSIIIIRELYLSLYYLQITTARVPKTLWLHVC